MPLSRRAHPAKRTRQAVGAASGVTYLAVTAVIGVSVRSQAEAAETVTPPVDETTTPTSAPETLAFVGAAQPAPALPVFPEMTAIDGIPTSLPEIEPADSVVAPTIAPSTTQAPSPKPTNPTTTAQPATTVAPATSSPAGTEASTTTAVPATTNAPTTAPPTTPPPTPPPTSAPPTTQATTTSAPPTTPTTDAS